MPHGAQARVARSELTHITQLTREINDLLAKDADYDRPSAWGGVGWQSGSP